MTRGRVDVKRFTAMVCITQGKNLDDGCSREDYRITVGVANCTIVDFTSNEITCEPPVYKPQVNATWSSYCLGSANALAVVVSH